jgi:dTDP-L-rhamnose 4-epimerase
MKILVTGGCGFIGSHLVDRLVSEGHKVRVYDFLEPQIHGFKKPVYLNKGAEYIYADIRNREKLKKALKGMEFVFHEASRVGVGQSMYEIEKYVAHNSYGTAVLLDLLVNTKNKVQKIVAASSMTIYGEGAYRCVSCGVVYPQLRKEEQLKKKKWEMQCPECGKAVNPLPTSEEAPLLPTSVYSTTKRCQEELCLEAGKAYKIPAVALRYFNVYGTRQSLNNPYTGVCAIFLSRIKNKRPPLIFEDGRQSRDFVHVSDIVEANMLALKNIKADYKFFNVGTGIPHSILETAKKLVRLGGKKLAPEVLYRSRAGDIRHCYADISKINSDLGFTPKVSFTKGMQELIEWSESQEAVDLTHKAQGELKRKGLTQ